MLPPHWADARIAGKERNIGALRAMTALKYWIRSFQIGT
jgi:hypothetical protein